MKKYLLTAVTAACFGLASYAFADNTATSNVSLQDKGQVVAARYSDGGVVRSHRMRGHMRHRMHRHMRHHRHFRPCAYTGCNTGCYNWRSSCYGCSNRCYSSCAPRTCCATRVVRCYRAVPRCYNRCSTGCGMGCGYRWGWGWNY